MFVLNYFSYFQLFHTWANAKDEANIPVVAITPPKIAVRLNPNESIKIMMIKLHFALYKNCYIYQPIRIPARGETKKVIPIESDPTRANYLHKYHRDKGMDNFWMNE